MSPRASRETPTERVGSWGRWHAIAVAGLLVIALVSAGGVAGAWLADSLEAPSGIGQIGGLILGFLASRSMLRRLMQRQLA